MLFMLIAASLQFINRLWLTANCAAQSVLVQKIKIKKAERKQQFMNAAHCSVHVRKTLGSVAPPVQRTKLKCDNEWK